MRRGFTLLELMIVLIIVGVLATLGVMQYQSAIEKSRGGEARQVIGQLRTQCAALYMEDTDTADCTDENLGIGVEIPDTAGTIGCAATHFFTYEAIPAAPNGVTFIATRCQAGGKNPDRIALCGGGNCELQLDVDYTASDDWITNGGY